MRAGKLITFNIVLLIAIMNLLLIKFASGVEPLSYSLSYFKSLSTGAFSFVILWATGLFATLGYVLTKGIYKKNFLRVNLIIFIILTIVEIVLRILEIKAGVFCGICWLQLVLYIILLILTIMMLKDLQKLIRELFTR